jgi:hypothetical protein
MFYGPEGDGEDEEIEQEAPSLPPWMGPPEDELGAVVPLALVIGRSENGVVALRHATGEGQDGGRVSTKSRAAPCSSSMAEVAVPVVVAA